MNFQEVKNTKKCVGKSSLVKRSKTTLLDLNEDVLELIVGYLDTESALNLFRVCKTINARLEGACGFWYQLCSKEKFIDYHALKQSDDIDPEHPLWDYRWHHSKPPPTATPPVRKKRRTNDSSSRGGRQDIKALLLLLLLATALRPLHLAFPERLLRTYRDPFA